MCRSRTVPLESTISQAIAKAIKQRFGARAVVRKRHVSMGRMGDPDLYGAIDGRHFEIETKRPGNNPTELQLARLAEWRAAGAIAGVAHSVEEAMKILPGEEK